MSEEAKKTVKEAQKFFEQVQEGATKYQSIPDSSLQQKIKKVQESAGDVSQYIKEKVGK
jgi:hypothetical protein